MSLSRDQTEPDKLRSLLLKETRQKFEQLGFSPELNSEKLFSYAQGKMLYVLAEMYENKIDLFDNESLNFFNQALASALKRDDIESECTALCRSLSVASLKKGELKAIEMAADPLCWYAITREISDILNICNERLRNLGLLTPKVNDQLGLLFSLGELFSYKNHLRLCVESLDAHIRGEGIGTLLLNCACTRALEMNLWLSLVSTEEASQRFYPSFFRSFLRKKYPLLDETAILKMANEIVAQRSFIKIYRHELRGDPPPSLSLMILNEFQTDSNLAFSLEDKTFCLFKKSDHWRLTCRYKQFFINLDPADIPLTLQDNFFVDAHSEEYKNQFTLVYSALEVFIKESSLFEGALVNLYICERLNEEISLADLKALETFIDKLEKNQLELNAISPIKGTTTLHLAVAVNAEAYIRAKLKTGINLNDITDGNHNTLLWLAISQQHSNLIGLLLEYDAKPKLTELCRCLHRANILKLILPHADKKDLLKLKLYLNFVKDRHAKENGSLNAAVDAEGDIESFQEDLYDNPCLRYGSAHQIEEAQDLVRQALEKYDQPDNLIRFSLYSNNTRDANSRTASLSEQPGQECHDSKDNDCKQHNK